MSKGKSAKNVIDVIPPNLSVVVVPEILEQWHMWSFESLTTETEVIGAAVGCLHQHSKDSNHPLLLLDTITVESGVGATARRTIDYVDVQDERPRWFIGEWHTHLRSDRHSKKDWYFFSQPGCENLISFVIWKWGYRYAFVHNGIPYESRLISFGEREYHIHKPYLRAID